MRAKKSEEYLSDIEKCVRCGSCTVNCPTLHEDPLEGMGARGRLVLMKSFLEGRIGGTKLLNDRIFSCILCGACAGLCPLGVDIPESIYRGRAKLRSTDRRRRYLRGLVKFSAKWPDLTFKLARVAQHALLPVLAKRGLIPFSPEIPEQPLRTADQVFKVTRKRGRVALFTGCSINYVFPHYGESLINVLQKLKYEVVLPKGEVCCGTPLRSLGLEEEARELAKKNLRVFHRLKVDAILSLCPTCTLTIRQDYPKLIGDGLEKAQDLSSFLIDKLGPSERIGKTAVYHDPCHLRFGLGVTREPREIIQRSGVEVVQAGEQECCGFGGVFCFSHRQLATGLLERRTAPIIDSSADLVVTSCPGCILQLSRTIKDRPVLHLVELIEDAYCFRSERAHPRETEPAAEPRLF